jgi:cell division protein FtsA
MLLRGNYVTGLDIGTTKICAIIGEADAEGQLVIHGVGSSPSYGLRRGIVVDIEATADSIHNAVTKAENMAGARVENVFVGIAGSHIESFNNSALMHVKSPVRGASRREVQRLNAHVRVIETPADRDIIHCIPQDYIADGVDGVRDPVGYSCSQLELRAHLVTAGVAPIQNLVKSVCQAGYEVSDILLESLASSLALLSEDAKRMGVLLIDIGGGTTDIAIFANGSVRFTAELELGGDVISEDIYKCLDIPLFDAENIKKKHGSALSSKIPPDETIETTCALTREPLRINRRHLAEIIQARVEEVLTRVRDIVWATSYRDNLYAGVTLTGGTALLQDISDLAEGIFDLRTIVAMPTDIRGLSGVVTSPIYSTGIGLALHGLSPYRWFIGNGTSKLRRTAHYVMRLLGISL